MANRGFFAWGKSRPHSIADPKVTSRTSEDIHHSPHHLVNANQFHKQPLLHPAHERAYLNNKNNHDFPHNKINHDFPVHERSYMSKNGQDISQQIHERNYLANKNNQDLSHAGLERSYLGHNKSTHDLTQERAYLINRNNQELLQRFSLQQELADRNNANTSRNVQMFSQQSQLHKSPDLLRHLQRQPVNSRPPGKSRPHSMYYDGPNLPPQLDNNVVDRSNLSRAKKYPSTANISTDPRRESAPKNGNIVPSNHHYPPADGRHDIHYRDQRSYVHINSNVRNLANSPDFIHEDNNSNRVVNKNNVNNGVYKADMMTAGMYHKNRSVEKHADQGKDKPKTKEKYKKEGKLSHDKKAKLYKSSEELSKIGYHPVHVQQVEELKQRFGQKADQNKIPSPGNLKRREKSLTLERLDNIDSMSDQEARILHRAGSQNSLDSENRSELEMREVQSKQYLWMEEQERLRRSALDLSQNNHKMYDDRPKLPPKASSRGGSTNSSDSSGLNRPDHLKDHLNSTVVNGVTNKMPVVQDDIQPISYPKETIQDSPERPSPISKNPMNRLVRFISLFRQKIYFSLSWLA